MTNEQFSDLVHRAENLAARSPRLYRLLVAALARAGYAVVWGLLHSGSERYANQEVSSFCSRAQSSCLSS
jgi:hypothetical protein